MYSWCCSSSAFILKTSMVRQLPSLMQFDERKSLPTWYVNFWKLNTCVCAQNSIHVYNSQKLCYSLSFILTIVLALEHEGIIGGVESPSGKYLYQVSLQQDGTHFCSGGILGPFYVITAAHCVINANTNKIPVGSIEIVGGVNDLNLELSMTRETSEVTEIHLPSEYFERIQSRSGDIAILKVNLEVCIALHTI